MTGTSAGKPITTSSRALLAPVIAGRDADPGAYLVDFGEPGGARTRDHRIKSAMLYQLSYRLCCMCKKGGAAAEVRLA
jgi:hypothetical protein